MASSLADSSSRHASYGKDTMEFRHHSIEVFFELSPRVRRAEESD
jgi:hypothetical protein